MDEAGFPVVLPPAIPKAHQFGALTIGFGVTIIDRFEPGQFLAFLVEFFASPCSGLNVPPEQPGFVAVETERVGAEIDAVKMIVAEGVEFLITAVFSIDYQGLVIRDVISLAQVFKNGGHPGLESFGEKLVGDIFVLLVFAGNYVDRPLSMAGVDPDGWGEGINLHSGEKRAAPCKVVA